MTSVPDPTPDHQTGDDIIDRWERDTTYSTYGTPVAQLIDTGDLMAAEIGRLRAAVTAANQRAEQAEAVIRGVLTCCRECRDLLPIGASVPAAEFIVWGKLNPPEALGPKCYDHAANHLGHGVAYRSSGHAVVDLRPLRALVADQPQEVTDG